MRICLGITVKFEQSRDNGGFNMNDWARSEAEKLKKAIADKSAKDDLFQERQKIKREHGIEKWDEVKKQLSEQCDSVNIEMGQAVLKIVPKDSRSVDIHASVSQMTWYFHVNFKGETGPLETVSHNGTPSGSYELCVNENGQVDFHKKESPVASSPESIAKEIIGKLLDTISRI